ncbi:MAG: hypothetical protein WCT77_08590 [Bacteroidota bacterium]
MKLGVSYNLFDGVELLRKSIMSVRANVDYINVVFQGMSNHNKPLTRFELNNALQILNDLKKHKLINEILPYNPNFNVPAQQNELIKRVTGVIDVKKHKCTHVMSMDCDELYKPEQLKAVKDYINKNKILQTACRMQTYYKSMEYRLVPPEEYYVTLIHDITGEYRIFSPTQVNILCDPTRRMVGEYTCFEREAIEMHHLSYVRKNLRQKLENSSSLVNFTPENIDFTVDYFDKWKYPQQALILRKELDYSDVEKI